MALWESEEALRASQQVTDQRRTDGAKALGIAIQSMEWYEVAVEL